MVENDSTIRSEHAEHAGHTEHTEHAETKRKLEAKVRKFKYISAVLAVAIVILAAYLFYPSVISIINGPAVGQRLTSKNNPLSSSELAAINNAPNSYFETSGEMLLNLTIPGETRNNGTYVGVVYMMKQMHYAPFVVNGKPSAIYVGATSCIYCAENRWAMALALSRFGSFGSLYKGYSALGDGDVPTLFWAPQNITGSGSADFKNYYSSNYINFFSGEYDSPINGSFQAPSGGYSFFIQSAKSQSDILAMEYIANLSQFRGTPATFFGTTLNQGADAVVFGLANSTTQKTTFPPITFMTHSAILNQLGSMSSTFAVEEYAAADVYVAQICMSLNNTAPVCALPAITSIESIIA